MNKFRVFLRLHRAFAVAALALLLLGLNANRDLQRARKRLQWAPVERKTLYRSVSSAGVLEAVHVEVVKSQVNETVLRVLATDGQRVKAGQWLAQLSNGDTKLEFEQHRNAFAAAASDLEKATREVAIQKRLYRSRAVPLAQVEDAERAAARAVAARDIARQQMELARAKLDSVKVRSPMDGVVLKIYPSVGDRVAPDKELIAVGDISQFIVRAKVDELEIRNVKIGQPARIHADAFPGSVLRGRVTAVATQAERDNFAKIEVIISVDNADKLPLRHNLSVRADIITETIPGAFGIPAKFVQRKRGADAWVIVRRGFLIRERKITLGRPAGDEVEVVGGLQNGDQVGLLAPEAGPA